MPTNMEQLETIYDRLYQLSLQVSELIERELYEDLIKYFQKKEQLLAEASQIVDKIDKSSVTEKFRDLAAKYQEQEKANIEALKKVKDLTQKELLDTTKNVKLVGAYRPNRENIMGNILDFSE